MRPTVCDALLARVAGLPAARLDALAQDDALAVVGRAQAAAERQAADAAPLEAALGALVPAPALERPLRRAVLTLRRDVHNGRAPTTTPAVLEAIERLLEPAAAAALARWRHAAEERRAALAGADERLEAELARAARALLEAAAEPELARGLALASPALIEQTTAGRTGAAARPESRLARSLTAYLARAGVKTSPFSTLTQVALAGFADAAPVPSPLGRSVTLVARALATDLLRACALDEQLAGALRYAANPGLVPEPWPPRLVTPRYTWVDGFAWRHDRVTEVGAYERQLAVLQRLPAGAHAEYLAALGGADAHPAFVRMVATGMLRPVAPWTRSEPRPLAVLAERVPALADPLRRLDAAADRLAATPAAQRPRALRDLRTDAAAAYAATSTAAPSWLRSAPLVHEDVAPSFALPPLPDAVREELARLGERMRPHVVRSRILDELVAHFVAQHGPGGACADPLGFLVGFMARPDASAVLAAASRADWRAARAGDDDRRAAAVGASSAPPTAAVFFQLAARDRAALARGDFLLVPNQYNPGTGALLARHLPLLEQPALVASLRRWLHDLHPDALVVELPVAADWNDLQHLGTGLLPPLAWPGELPSTEPAPPLRLADLTLRHDPAGDTLGLSAADGRPVAPVYLGTVPAHLVLGPLRLLLTLANPWIIAQPEGSAWSEAQGRPATPATVERSPRVLDGRLVLARARWRVGPAEFPRRREAESRLAFLARADRWRRGHGMPVEAFMTVARRVRGLRARERKPLWLRFDSLHALEAAGRLLDGGAVAVELVESLPGPGERWLRDGAGEARAAEFVALLRWPRPPVRGEYRRLVAEALA